MNRRSLLTTAVSGTIAVAGCTSNSGPTTEFETTIESFSTTTPVYADYIVKIRVENVGNESGTYPVKFVVGDTARSQSLTLAPDESDIVTFSHTFETPGVRTVAIDGTEQEVTVVKYAKVFDDPILESTHTAMANLSTLTEMQTRNFVVYPDVISPLDEDETGEGEQITLAETSTTAYEFETNRCSASMERTLSGSTRTIEKWFADGRVYTREQPEGKPVETSVKESTFSEAQRTNPPRLLAGINPHSRRETETQYVYTVDHSDSVALKNFIDAAVPESDLISGYTDYIETFEGEIHIDKNTRYITAVEVAAELVDDETDETMGTIDLALDYSGYNETVDVSVPQSVTAAVGVRPQ